MIVKGVGREVGVKAKRRKGAIDEKRSAACDIVEQEAMKGVVGVEVVAGVEAGVRVTRTVRRDEVEKNKHHQVVHEMLTMRMDGIVAVGRDVQARVAEMKCATRYETGLRGKRAVRGAVPRRMITITGGTAESMRTASENHLS